MKVFNIPNVFGVVITTILIFSVIISSYFIYSPNRFDMFVSDTSYGIESLKFYNDTTVKEVSNLCDMHNNSYNKVNCVVKFYEGFFEYERREGGGLLSPTEMALGKPGLCRDFAVAIKLTLDNLNIENQYIYSPKHIFNLVLFDYKKGTDIRYCIIDLTNGEWDNMWCS